MGSLRIAMGFHPLIAAADQPLALEPLIRHPGLRRQRARQMPVAFAAERRQDCLACERPQSQQVADLRAHVSHCFQEHTRTGRRSQ